MIFVVVLDTSASMNQRSASGLTLLDAGKAAIEHFIRVRSRDAASRQDRYLLVTLEEGDAILKVGWKDPPNKFLEEVKCLQARGLTALGAGLRCAFDTLTWLRHSNTSIDNYGLGRLPTFLPHLAAVWLLTDGGELTTSIGIDSNLTLPESTSPGVELTAEPFRWDQTLFVTMLRLPGIGSASVGGGAREADLTNLAEVTGGRLSVVTSMKQTLQSVELMMPRLTPSVMVSMQVAGHTPVPVRLFVRNVQGLWPVPEAYWPSEGLLSLPQRPAHPLIKLEPGNEPTPASLEILPADKYEMEAGPGVSSVLQRAPKTGVLVAVTTARRPGAANWTTGEPYGYIKTTGGQTFLHLLPHNFPRLLKLVEEFPNLRNHMTPQWRNELEGYLRAVPPYYLPPLRYVFGRIGMPTPTSQRMESVLPSSVYRYLMKLKKTVEQGEQRAPGQRPTTVTSAEPMASTSTTPQSSPPLQPGTTAPPPSLSLSLPAAPDATARINLFDQKSDTLVHCLSQLKRRLRGDETKSGGPARATEADTYAKHHVAIGNMGNFAEALRTTEVLRDPFADEDAGNPLVGLGGNPWAKKGGGGPRADLGIDEADDAFNARGRRKRRMPRRRETAGEGGVAAVRKPLLVDLPAPSPSGSPSATPASTSTALPAKLSLIRRVREGRGPATADAEAVVVGVSALSLDPAKTQRLIKELALIATLHRRAALASLISQALTRFPSG
mmetsp:Transcript_65116/g.153762  ORF Transcript_65116/g.153762 Transcript_65116/m.153762 type:complete len:722 (-) Transcript_65116:1014-3179(-)